jgi:hypothetical protein
LEKCEIIRNPNLSEMTQASSNTIMNDINEIKLTNQSLLEKSLICDQSSNMQLCMYCIDTCDICHKKMCQKCTLSSCGHINECVNCVSTRCEQCEKDEQFNDEIWDEYCDRLQDIWWDNEFERRSV